jgi:hypothetical protein
MSDNKSVTEQHGCIVCGKAYNVLVVYSPSRKFIDCAVTSAGGHRVPDEHRPLVACDRHSAKEIEAAVANRYPGSETEEDREGR